VLTGNYFGEEYKAAVLHTYFDQDVYLLDNFVCPPVENASAILDDDKCLCDYANKVRILILSLIDSYASSYPCCCV